MITGVSWSSFDSKDALNRLFTKDRVAKTLGDVRELLVISPLNLVLVTLVVIVMACSWSVPKSLLMVDLLSLREPGASGLPPSMVELKVDVVQVIVRRLTMGHLVKLGWDVALLV